MPTPAKAFSAARRRAPARQGFTLVEILLVLCVLVILGAFAWPVLINSFETQRLRSAADSVRTCLLRARTEAVRSGVPYAFLYLPDGVRYSLGPAEAATVSADASAANGLPGNAASNPAADNAAAAGATATPASESMLATSDGTAAVTLSGTLPDGVAFAAPAGTSNASATAASELQTLPDGQLAILFYPDGAASGGTIILHTPRGRRMELTLRGLTGVVTLSDILVETTL